MSIARIMHNCHVWFWLLWIPSVLAAVRLPAAELELAEKKGMLEVEGEIADPEDVSAIAFHGKRLVLAVDEGATVQVLKRLAEGKYRAEADRSCELPTDVDGKELDLEGLACGDKYIFAIGSHSRKRKTVKNDPEDDETAAENLERLRTTEIEPSRDRLYRFEIDEDGKPDPDSVKVVTLRNIFDNDPVLRRFQAIPSKENGIDIEGIAADGDKDLYIGFRGPVLRDGYVPILELTFKEKFREKDIEYKTRFVNLGGRGVRDMVQLTGDDVLILSGPMGDGPGSYRLYLWDGRDCVPGEDERDALDHCRPLCEIPVPPNEEGARAEGIAVLSKTHTSLRFVIVYDGVENGAPTIFECDR
jgi:hypothetical protein